MKQSATILIVEDEVSLLEGMADLLEVASISYDLEVLTATNGEAALLQMQQRTPDLIISDIMMPHMDGYELLAEIRRHPSWVYIPFIFLTAKGRREDFLEGRRRGAELYITKPFRSAELIELIESQLKRVFQLRAARERRLLGLKRDIMQVLNHELRTPLTYVTAYYEMLTESLERLEESNNLQGYLRGIQNGCLRLTRLIQDLIAILEIRSGEMAMRIEQGAEEISDPAALLREAGRNFERAAAARHIRLLYQLAPHLPPIYGHRAFLQDALERLIDNAIKFTPARPGDSPVVHLTAGVQGDWLKLSVQDEGIGFPEYVSSQLFEPFFQHNRQKLEQQGSGSGLAIAKGLVELHRGHIKVTSAEGAGAVFDLFLPVYHGKGQLRLREPYTQRRAVTVLVVEDDRFLLAGLRELLEVYQGKYELHVLTAVNGAAGLKVLEQHRPDVIISDVMMPVMDGYEFLRHVRQNPAWLQIPFIFLTARGEQEDIHKGLRSGVEEYIPKPYDVDELLHLVVTQLDRHFQVQSAVNQSFEELKQGVLNLLRPDFMAPLESVSEHSEKLVHGLEEVQTDEDLKSSLHSIQTAGERLTGLVEDFIGLVEFKTGEAEASFAARATRIPGRELTGRFNAAAYNMRARAQAAGVAHSFSLPDELPDLYCDPLALIQSVERLHAALLALHRDPMAQPLLEVAVQIEEEQTLAVVLALREVALEEETVQQMERLARPDHYDIVGLPEWGSSVVVARSVMALHGGRIEVTSLPDALRLTAVIPLRTQPEP